MAALLVLLFPLVLLAFMLLMERVESPLRKVAVETDVADFLDNARPDEVDTFVRYGLRRALDRLRKRQRRTLRIGLPGRRTTRTPDRHTGTVRAHTVAAVPGSSGRSEPDADR